MPRIIDAHVHLSGETQDELIPYASLNGLKYTLDELLRLMGESGVRRGFLLSPPLRGGVPLPNERVLELCRRSVGLLAPILTVEPTAENVAGTILLAKKNRAEVKGFKVRLGYLKVFADDPVYDALYSYAESEDLPVMFHTGDTASSTGSLQHSHPLTLDRLANKRAGLKIVACHFGNPWVADVAELIYKHPNVYADLSGLVTGGGKYGAGYVDSVAEQVTRAIYFAGGAEKVIFGTDYPVSTPSMTLGLVAKLRIDAGRLREDSLEERGQGVPRVTEEASRLVIDEVAASERAPLEAILDQCFTGIYLRHARRTLADVETVRVARMDGTPIGLAMLKLLTENAGYVYYIAVLPSSRRTGVGARLLADSLEHFAVAGASEVYASVGAHNVESKALFMGRGFRRTDYGEVSKKYGALKAFSMYRSMWVVPGEMLLVKDTLTLPPAGASTPAG